MDLITAEHVLLARAALASGNPDALDALVRAALAETPALRDHARMVILAEARSRGLAAVAPDGAPDDAPATADDYARLRGAFATARDRGDAPSLAGAPRWLALAAAMRERWRAPASAPVAGTERA
jgi:hypothetical protein